MSYGVNLFDLFAQFPKDINTPKSINDIPALIIKCRKSGYDEAADFLENWLMNMNYHIEAEWRDYDYSSKR